MSRGYFDTNEEPVDRDKLDQGRAGERSRSAGKAGTENVGNDLMQGEDIGKGYQPSRRQPSAIEPDEEEV